MKSHNDTEELDELKAIERRLGNIMPTILGGEHDDKAKLVSEFMKKLTSTNSPITAQDFSEFITSFTTLIQNNSELREVLTDLQKLPIFEELTKDLSESHDATTREHETTEQQAAEEMPDIVDNEAENQMQQSQKNSGINQNEEESEEERKKKMAQQNQQGGGNVSNHYSNSQELDLKQLGAFTAKMSGALALALTCGPFGIILAAMFLYAARNIANGKEVSHVDSPERTGQDTTRGDQYITELIEYQMQQNRQTGGIDNSQKANSGVITDMKQDIKPNQKALGESQKGLVNADNHTETSAERTEAVTNKVATHAPKDISLTH